LAERNRIVLPNALMPSPPGGMTSGFDGLSSMAWRV